MDVLTLYHLLFSSSSASAALIAGGLSLVVGVAPVALFYRRPRALHLSRFDDTPLGRRLSNVQGWALTLRTSQRLLPALLVYAAAWTIYANRGADQLPVWQAAAIYSLLAVAFLLVLGSFLWGPKVDRALGQIGQSATGGGVDRSLAQRVSALHELEGKPNAPALFPFLYQSMVARLQNLRLRTELPWRWRDLAVSMLFAGCTLAVLLLFLGSLASLVNETAEDLQSQEPLLAQRTSPPEPTFLPPAAEPEKKETAPPFPPEDNKERTGGEQDLGSSPTPYPGTGKAPPGPAPEVPPEPRAEEPDASPGQGSGDSPRQDPPSGSAPETPPDRLTPPSEREPSETPPGVAGTDSPGEPQPQDGAAPRGTLSPAPEPKPDGEPGGKGATDPATSRKEGPKEGIPSNHGPQERQPVPRPEPRSGAGSHERTASREPASADPSAQRKPCPSPSCSKEKPCGSCPSPGAGKENQPAVTRGKEAEDGGRSGSAAPSQTPEQIAESEGTSAPGFTPDGKEQEKPGADQVGGDPENGTDRDEEPPRMVSAPPEEPRAGHGDGAGPPLDRGGTATEGDAGNTEYEEMKIRSQPSRNQDLAGKDFEPEDGTPRQRPDAPPSPPRHNPRVDLKPNRYVEPLPLSPQRVPAEYRAAFRKLFRRDE